MEKMEDGRQKMEDVSRCLMTGERSQVGKDADSKQIRQSQLICPISDLMSIKLKEFYSSRPQAQINGMV